MALTSTYTWDKLLGLMEPHPPWARIPFSASGRLFESSSTRIWGLDSTSRDNRYLLRCPAHPVFEKPETPRIYCLLGRYFAHCCIFFIGRLWLLRWPWDFNGTRGGSRSGHWIDIFIWFTQIAGSQGCPATFRQRIDRNIKPIVSCFIFHHYTLFETSQFAKEELCPCFLKKPR